MEIIELGENLFVAAQISPSDLETLAARGFRSVISNRPDGEAPDQASFADISREAHRNGMEVRYSVDRGANFIASAAFAEEALCAAVDCSHHQIGIVTHRKDERSEFGSLRRQLANELKSGAVRKLSVDDDDVWAELCDHRAGFDDRSRIVERQGRIFLKYASVSQHDNGMVLDDQKIH